MIFGGAQTVEGRQQYLSKLTRKKVFMLKYLLLSQLNVQKPHCGIIKNDCLFKHPDQPDKATVAQPIE